MNNSCFFSVIVPVYNTEKYIRQCIESILNQTFSNFELILVDDGSTDDSFRMCTEYVDRDSRIVLLQQENAGQSVARNKAIDCAKGEFIIFVDSDDYISQTSLNEFYQTIIENDSIEIIEGYGYIFEDKNNIRIVNQEKISLKTGMSGIEYYTYSYKMRNLRNAPVFYVCRKSFLNQHNLRFKEGFIHEDELWVPQLCLNAKKMMSSTIRFYYQRVNPTSTTRSLENIHWRAICRMKISLLLSEELNRYSSKRHLKSFEDNIAALYMFATYDGSLYKTEKIDRFFPIKHARYMRTIGKAIIFLLSPYLACKLRKYKT